MDVTTAMSRTDQVVSELIAGLRPDQRELRTPCDQWNVHDLIGHMCGGGLMIAGALAGQAPPEDPPDPLADGPAAGWAATSAALRQVATPEVLGANHTLPFGEMPGSMALSVIVADQLTHGWDLAKATAQGFDIDDELAAWALGVWAQLSPAEGRTGDAFKPAVPVADDAPTLDKLIAFTGRQP